MISQLIKTDNNKKFQKVSLRALSFLISLCLLIGAAACSSATGQNDTETSTQNGTVVQTGSTDSQGPPDSEIAPSTIETGDKGNKIDFGFTPNPKDTLSMQLLDKEINLDPFSELDGFPVDTESGSNLIYETLLQWDPERLTYVSGLAELVDITAQGIEIKLREGARWHDGRPVTLEQIEISLYWMSKYYDSFSAAEGLIVDVAMKTPTDNKDTILLSLADRDDYHLSIALDFLCRAPIMPTTLWSSGEDSLIISIDELRAEALRRPMGTGQWKVLLNDGFQLVLERQRDAEDNKPLYLMLRKYKDETAQQRAIANKEVDFLAGAVSDLSDKIEYYPGRSVLAGIRSNSDNELLSNPYVLNLLQLSLDTNATGKALDSRASSTIFWHYFGGPTLVNALRTRLSKPEFAETYLDNKEDVAAKIQGEIGSNGLLYLDGKQVPALELILPKDDIAAEDACKIFSDRARKQGLIIELTKLPTEEYVLRLSSRQYDLAFVQTEKRQDTPLSLAESFLRQGGEVKEDLDQTGQDIFIELATAITTSEFAQATERAFRYSLAKMRFFPLGFRTINDNYCDSDNWTNFSQYWSSHQDNRDITGIGATAIFDSITAKNR